MSETKSVLFMCSMNAIRSPMAEFLVKDIFGQEIFTQSAGVHAGGADSFMIAVMKERGIEVPNHEPRTLEDTEETYYDLIVTLSAEAHERTLEYTRGQPVEIERWPITEPSDITGQREHVMQGYRDIRDDIEERIRKRFGD